MSGKLITSACIGALALSAFALTSTASAQWMVGGTNLTGTERVSATAAVHKSVELKTGGVTISCVSKTIEGTSPQIEAGNTGSAQSLIFRECSANASCTLGSSALATVPLTTTAVLGVSPVANITLKPKTKTVFATFKFEGAECPLLGTQTLSGSVKVLAPTGQTEKEAQLSEVNVTETSGELKQGSSAAALKGSWLETMETHRPWSFL